MLVIDSPRAKGIIAAGWLTFASANAAAMYLLPGKETIPYHLIWASFAFLYGLSRWSRATTWTTFTSITVITGIPLLRHARAGHIGWEECSEIVLMGVIAALLVWHVNRQQSTQDRIVELREAERVRARNRELATRFGSHELRTRLTIARGFTDLIRENAADDETRADAGLALAELDKASDLATNLMTLVRMDVPHALRPVDVDELVDSVVRRWVVREKRAWTSASAAGLVLGDDERLEAAIDCLIENAVKFTGPTDSITLSARVDGRDVVICVDDTGTGIPPDDLAHVTELFHVSSNAGARAGSGLGLPIVRAIIEACGGTLQIRSELGVGTCVSVRLPRVPTARLAHRDFVERSTEQTVRSVARPQLAHEF